MKLFHHDSGRLAVAGEGVAGDLVLHHYICIGLNYAGHAEEQGARLPERPLVFTKSPAAGVLPGEAIIIPEACRDRPQVDFEGELAVVIGRRARDVSREEALDFVLGYAAANDVSARWWQKEGAGRQFYRGKSFDTFCPLSSPLAPAAAVPDPQRLTLRTVVSGETLQEASTADMIFSVPELIAELSRGMTLLPGTVLLTGTPAGVGFARSPQRFLRAGDLVRVEIDEVGCVESPVVEAPRSPR